MSRAPAPVRRVVTGHDAEGRAVVLLDGPPPVTVTSPLQEGLRFVEIWNTEATPAPVDTGPDPTVGRPVATPPPPGGTIIRIVDIPPEGPLGLQLSRAETDALFAKVGLHRVVSRHGAGLHPLMHRTQSVDYGIVLSGEVHLVLDDTEVRLTAGDVVVQRGTVHAWSNRSVDTPCRIAFILVDGRYSDELAAKLR